MAIRKSKPQGSMLLCPHCETFTVRRTKAHTIAPDGQIPFVLRYYKCTTCGSPFRTVETWIPDTMNPVTGEYYDNEDAPEGTRGKVMVE